MKLESFSAGKFGQFENNRIDKMNFIIGGYVQQMSKRQSGSLVSHDKAPLTANGVSYDGKAGDGTASDWGTITWHDGPGQWFVVDTNPTDPECCQPELGEYYEYGDASTAAILNIQYGE